ncbi:type VII secretion target [Nocardia gipuzkoensis]
MGRQKNEFEIDGGRDPPSMPEYLQVEPDQLRAVAKQHDLAAANIRKWGEIPHAWLADFPSKYGTIADPVRAALVDYYKRRHDKAERLAANHERSRDELIASAQALEDADQSGGSQIGRAGGGFDHKNPSAPPAPAAPPSPGAPPSDPAAPTDSSPDTPVVDGAEPAQPAATTSDSDMPGQTGDPGHVPGTPAAPAPQVYDGPVAGVAAPPGTTLPFVGVPESGADVPATTRAEDAGGGASAALDDHKGAGMAVDANTGADLAGGMPVPLATGSSPATVGDSGAGAARRTPAPLATGPFAAAFHAVKDRQTLPSLVVGERVEDDLALARTLLAATLAAVADSAPGLEWAVAVGRTPVGPIVVLTSAEGRGWLPPGLFLPSEVSLPWRWDFVLGGAAGRQSVAALEATGDPARMLAEFGAMVGGRRSVGISALVSSGPVHDDLRAALGDDVALEGGVSAAESAVDFTSPGVGLVDRLTLAGSGELLQQAEMVPETEIRGKCLELARAADARVRAAVSDIDGEVYIHRAHRQRILDALDAGQPVPGSWWDEVRAADDMMAAALRSRRLDVSHLPVGGVRPDVSGAEALRDMFFERRAEEVLLLLAAGDPDRQTLRDVLYCYGQITEHPLLPAAQPMETIGVRSAVPDVQSGRSAGPEAYATGAVSVSSIGLGGAPPSVAELWNGSTVSGAPARRGGADG